MEAISKEEQKRIIEINECMPFKTSTYINFDGSINTGHVAEKVDVDETVDGSIGLKEPTGDVKTKFDELDERTINGCNWDKIDVKSVLG